MVRTVSLLLFVLGLVHISMAQTYTNSPEEKMKLSYALGYLNGQAAVMDDYETFYEAIRVEAYLSGFKANIKSRELSQACDIILQNPYMQQGDSMVLMDLEILSECQGRYLGATFCGQIMDEHVENDIDFDVFALGFEENIRRMEPKYSESEMKLVVSTFGEALGKKAEEEKIANDKKLFERTQAWKKPMVLDNGIVIHTLQKGKGKERPTAQDDIIAHYVVIDNKGNQTESSYDVGMPMTVNLGNLIEGWKLSLVHFSKGGKYEVYIPSNLGYNQGSLIFTIELIDFGPAGSLVKSEE